LRSAIVEGIIGVSPLIYQIIIPGNFVAQILIGDGINISGSVGNDGNYSVQATQLVQPSPASS